MRKSKQKPSATSDATSLNQAVKSIVRLSDYLDAANKSGALDPLSPPVDEPLPSMFRRDQDGIGSIQHARRGSSNAKTLLTVVGIFLFLTAGAGVLVLTSFSDKEPAKSAVAPVYPRAFTAEASFSPAAPDTIEVPQQPVAPTQPAMADGEPWSEMMDAYKKLLTQQDPSNASASRQRPDDRLLGQFDTWLKAKPQ